MCPPMLLWITKPVQLEPETQINEIAVTIKKWFAWLGWKARGGVGGADFSKIHYDICETGLK